MKTKSRNFKNNTLLTRLILPFIGMYLAWFFLYELVLNPWGFPDQELTYVTSELGKGILNTLGYPISVNHQAKSLYSLGETPVLLIANECNGLILFVLFAALLILLPGGKINQKLFYLFFGVACIFLLNLIRIVALTIIGIHAPSSLDFNHKYTFTIVVYSFIFFLWIGWGKILKRQQR